MKNPGHFNKDLSVQCQLSTMGSLHRLQFPVKWDSAWEYIYKVVVSNSNPHYFNSKDIGLCGMYSDTYYSPITLKEISGKIFN